MLSALSIAQDSAVKMIFRGEAVLTIFLFNLAVRAVLSSLLDPFLTIQMWLG